jgi:osmotically-inducible protein OsmY
MKPLALGVVGAGLMLVLALPGCDKRTEASTPGQKVDAAIASVDQKAEVARVELKRGAEEAKAAATVAMVDAKQATGEMAQAAGVALSDSAITGGIKASLATDSELKTLDIDVETHEGRAVLKGSAPNAAARARATQLASTVKGVATVDNRLTLKP